MNTPQSQPTGNGPGHQAHRRPIQCLSDFYLAEDQSAALTANALKAGSELDMLGQIINKSSEYKHPIPIHKFEGLHPKHLTQIEEHLERAHGCSDTGFIHVNRALFERVMKKEALLAREDRLRSFESDQSLCLQETPDRPLLTNSVILPGISSARLAFRIAAQAGIPLGKVEVHEFADTTLKVEVDYNVRRQRVFIVQNFSHDIPKQLESMQLLMAAVRLAGAAEINLVLPVFPYGREDRKSSYTRSAISAQVVASNLIRLGMDRLVTLDIHSQQTLGFFEGNPVDNLFGIPLTTRAAINDHRGKHIVLALPDQGMSKRAYDDRTLGIIEAQAGHPLEVVELRKYRPPNTNNKVERVEVLGESSALKDAIVILFDDLVDTGGTTVKVASELKAHGAKKVIVASALPVFSRNGVENLKYSETKVNGASVRAIDQVYVSDAIPMHKSGRDAHTGDEIIKVVPSAPLLGEAVRRLAHDDGASLRELLESRVFYL